MIGEAYIVPTSQISVDKQFWSFVLINNVCLIYITFVLILFYSHAASKIASVYVVSVIGNSKIGSVYVVTFMGNSKIGSVYVVSVMENSTSHN